MATPFFRSPYNPHARYFQRPSTTRPSPGSRPVISIPVHFVESDGQKQPKNIAVDKDAAAVKIQKVFRGFQVRKNLKAVAKIESEVAEIERRIRSADDLIRRDAKERLRINEMLMALLFRLDSVFGVRDYRKKVIRRAIMLQELVDSITAVDQAPKPVDSVAADGEAAAEQPMEAVQGAVDSISAVEQTPKPVDSVAADGDQTLEAAEEEPMEAVNSVSTVDQTPMEMVQEADHSISTVDQALETPEPTETLQEAVTLNSAGDDETVAADSISTADQTPDAPKEQECDLGLESWETIDPEVIEEAMNDNPTAPMEAERCEERVLMPVKEEKGEVLGLKEIMEKMAAENEKLKALVTELCERNALQCRLMGGLAQRVEDLEKVVQRMERKNKKNSGAGKQKTKKTRNGYCPSLDEDDDRKKDYESSS